MYASLETKKGEKIYKIARARERRTRDFSLVRCIKIEDERVYCEIRRS